MSSFNPSTHQLAGSSSSVTGGLIFKGSKPKSSLENPKDADGAVFKRPTSRLGLDRLARKKREEREAEGLNFPEKKARLLRREEESDDSNVRISFGKAARSSVDSNRKYREPLVETPSYTGGVSEDALQKVHSRLVGREQRHQGVYASSSSSSRNKEGQGVEGR